MSEYEDLRKLIVLNAVVDRRPEVHAAMLSELGKRERAGAPCPGWVELEQAAKGDS